MTIKDKILVDASDAAILCGVSKQTWMRAHKDGQVPEPRKLRSMIRWDVQELRAWTAAGCPERAKWNR